MANNYVNIPTGGDSVTLVGTSVTALVLDQLSADPSIAYSLRKLQSSYSGNAISVRRSSDNTVMDIGFDSSGNLNTAALLTFVNGGNGFIAAWYDQSGNGASALQATHANQPAIVTAGVVMTIPSVNQPTVTFDGAATFLAYTNTATLPITINSIFDFTNFTPSTAAALTDGANGFATTIRIFFGWFQSGVTPGYITYAGNETAGPNDSLIGVGPVPVNNDPHILTGVFSNTQDGDIYLDTALLRSNISAGSNTMGAQLIGKDDNGLFFAGNMSEFIIFNSRLSNADRRILEHNQSLYYGIV